MSEHIRALDVSAIGERKWRALVRNTTVVVGMIGALAESTVLARILAGMMVEIEGLVSLMRWRGIIRGLRKLLISAILSARYRRGVVKVRAVSQKGQSQSPKRQSLHGTRLQIALPLVAHVRVIDAPMPRIAMFERESQ
jgi:hypothetical protein